MEKPESIKKILLITLPTCAIVGIVMGYQMPEYKKVFGVLVYMGLSGIVGLLTNMLAIRMILDYVYVPLGFMRIRLPGSGLLPKYLPESIEAISEASTEVLTPEAVKKGIKDQKVIEKIGDLLQDDFTTGHTLDQFISLASKTVVDWVETDNFYFLLRDEIIKKYAEKKHSVKAFAVKVANWSGVIDYDDLTYKIIDGIKEKASELKGDRKALGELKNSLHKLVKGITTHSEDLEKILTSSLDTVLRKFDFGSVIKDKLDEFSPPEIKQMVLKISSGYLGWIEIWGGILGTFIGIIMGLITWRWL